MLLYFQLYWELSVNLRTIVTFLYRYFWKFGVIIYFLTRVQQGKFLIFSVKLNSFGYFGNFMVPSRHFQSLFSMPGYFGKFFLWYLAFLLLHQCSISSGKNVCSFWHISAWVVLETFLLAWILFWKYWMDCLPVQRGKCVIFSVQTSF